MIKDILTVGIFSLVIAFSIPKILEPYQNYKDFFTNVNGIGAVSHIDKYEYEAGSWLRQNTDLAKSPNSNVISDYATSYIFRGLTGMNTSASRTSSMSRNDWIGLQTQIRTIIKDPLDNQSNQIMKTIMRETQSDTLYLVLTKRTCWWIRQNDAVQIRYLPLPTSYLYNTYCSEFEGKIKRSPIFQGIYHNGNASIYKYVIHNENKIN